MDPNPDQNNSEQLGGQWKGGFLNRRKYLVLVAGIGAIGTNSGSALAASTESVERNGISFDRVVNADTDLGISDGDRVDSVLKDVADEGDTLVQFPPGEYIIGDLIHLRADNFGIESTTGNREDVVFKPVSGSSPTMFSPGNHSGFYFGSVTLDRRDEWDSSLTLMSGNFSDQVYIKDILVNGWAPKHGEKLLIFNITDPDGSALVEDVERRGPSEFGSYPNDTETTIFNGIGTKGDITYRNIEIHNATESGLYAGKTYGDIKVEDSYFKNCAHSAVRVTGNDSWIKNTTIEMDLDDLHPDARVVDPEGIELNRGIWIQSGDHDKGGPLIEDCDVIINNAGNGISGILNGGDSGGIELRNTRIECNQEDIFPVLIQSESSGKAGTPHDALLDGVSVTGEGSGRAAITIEGRDGTVVKNSCVQMPNGDGIEFEGTSNGTIENTNLNVGGRKTVFEGANVTTTNLTSDDSCPVPQLDS